MFPYFLKSYVSVPSSFFVCPFVIYYKFTHTNEYSHKMNICQALSVTIQ